MPAVKQALGEADAGRLLAELKSTGKAIVTLPDGASIDLDDEDIEVRLQAKEGWAAAQGKACVVVLSTELTPELVAEGLARDVVRLIQDQRKEIGCAYTDRIDIGIITQSKDLSAAIKMFGDYITTETLARSLRHEALDGVQSNSVSVAGNSAELYVRIVAQA
jgi:isoleucyl-tRNA synthetase